MKHSPRPWRIEHDPDDNRIYIQDGEGLREVAYIDLPDQWDFANARLIAAAPLLLEALQAARSWLGDYEDAADSGLDGLLLDIDAAIAAATEEE